MTKYAANETEKLVGSVSPDKVKLIVRSKVARGNPQLIGRSPEANGRFRLVGCLRSEFMSPRSLRTYPAEAQQQKHTKAMAVSFTNGKVNTLCDANNGTKTKMFLTHCCGRSADKADNIGDCQVPRITAGSENLRTFAIRAGEGATM